MKTRLLVFLLITATQLSVAQTTHTVTTPNFNFSPADITITEGDMVDFDLASFHNAVEVGDATSTTPKLGGFATPNGGEVEQFNTPGVYHYICTNHTSMRGTITVLAANSIKPGAEQIAFLDIRPNPAVSISSVNFQLVKAAEIEVAVYNSMGKKVLNSDRQLYSVGEHQVEFNAGNLEDGLYTATLLINGEALISRKIVVKK